MVTVEGRLLDGLSTQWVQALSMVQIVTGIVNGTCNRIQNSVAVCTRVAWLSHQCGGPTAHLLPEVLLNTDTYLYLFDSESDHASDFEELIEVQANVSSPVV